MGSRYKINSQADFFLNHSVDNIKTVSSFFFNLKCRKYFFSICFYVYLYVLNVKDVWNGLRELTVVGRFAWRRLSYF